VSVSAVTVACKRAPWLSYTLSAPSGEELETMEIRVLRDRGAQCVQAASMQCILACVGVNCAVHTARNKHYTFLKPRVQVLGAAWGGGGRMHRKRQFEVDIASARHGAQALSEDNDVFRLPGGQEVCANAHMHTRANVHT